MTKCLACVKEGTDPSQSTAICLNYLDDSVGMTTYVNHSYSGGKASSNQSNGPNLPPGEVRKRVKKLGAIYRNRTLSG